MALSAKISVFVGKTGEFLSVNPFFGRRVPAAPSGFKLLTFDRPTFEGNLVSDDDVKAQYEIQNDALVRSA